MCCLGSSACLRLHFLLDPKVATGVVFSYDNGLLLVQRAIEPSYGKWVFPGGYVDRGETLEAAALREVREESGLCVRLTRLLGYSQPGISSPGRVRRRGDGRVA